MTHGTYVEISAFVCITGDIAVMASNAGIFFAGVGTTFIILGAGFGGGLMMATSALKEPAEYRNRASAEPPSPDRVTPSLHGRGSAATATDCHCARTVPAAAATADERNPGASRKPGRKGRQQEG